MNENKTENELKAEEYLSLTKKMINKLTDSREINYIKSVRNTIKLMLKGGLFRNGEYEMNHTLIQNINKSLKEKKPLLTAPNIVQFGNENGENRLYALKEYDMSYRRLNIIDIENSSKRNVGNDYYLRETPAGSEYYFHQTLNPEKYNFLENNIEVICDINDIPEKEISEMKEELEKAGFYQENTQKNELTYGLSRILNIEDINIDRFDYFEGYEGIGIVDMRPKDPEKENLPIIKANMAENGEIRFSLLNSSEINQIKTTLIYGGNKNDIIKNEVLNYIEYNQEKIRLLNKDRERLKEGINHNQERINFISSSHKFTEEEKKSKIEFEKAATEKTNELISRINQEIKNLSNMNNVINERYKKILALDINRPAEQKAKEIGLDLKNQTQSTTKKQEQKIIYAPKKEAHKKGIKR